MNQRLLEMLDHFEITKVLYEYCHGCDRMDEVRMASVYASDGWDDHGPHKGPGREFARRTTRSVGAPKSVVHLMGQTLVKVNGNDAGAESHFIATVRQSAESGGETLNQIGGRYVDTLIRESGRWKIKRRICIREWSISVPVERDWLDGQGYVEGRRSNDDPSFAALGLQHSGAPGDGQA